MIVTRRHCPGNHDQAVGDEPWIMDSSARLCPVRGRSAIEDAGCRVRIGIATAADKAFIGGYANLDVEEDHKGMT